MKRILASALTLFVLTSPAAAQCYAHYKAKQDDPLRLHYGILALETSACSGNPVREVRARLAAQNWTLLTLVETTTETPSQQQRVNAGVYFLRF